MLPNGPDQARCALLTDPVIECRAPMGDGCGMDEIRRLLCERWIRIMDAILVTRELLGAGPADPMNAKHLVVTSPSRVEERRVRQQLFLKVFDRAVADMYES
jgi:hypothetical protein